MQRSPGSCCSAAEPAEVAYTPRIVESRRVCRFSAPSRRRIPALLTLNPSRAAWRAPPQSARTWVAGATRHCGEIHVFSVVIGFGVATLFATGFLFVVQMVDDFRGA